jgi:hypothetical protein
VPIGSCTTSPPRKGSSTSARSGSSARGIGRRRSKDRLPVEEYVARVVAGELIDPTLTVQLKRGFRLRGIIQDYVRDPSCDNKAAFII